MNTDILKDKEFAKGLRYMDTLIRPNEYRLEITSEFNNIGGTQITFYVKGKLCGGQIKLLFEMDSRWILWDIAGVANKEEIAITFMTTVEIKSTRDIDNKEEIAITFMTTVEIKSTRDIDNNSPKVKFWNLFLQSIKSTSYASLRKDIDYNIDAGILSFSFPIVYHKLCPLWYDIYKEHPPSMVPLSKDLKTSNYFIMTSKSIRIGKGNNSYKTKAFCFDLEKLPIEKLKV